MSSTAFIFPGQGSQSVGMLASLAARFPLVQQTFNEVGNYLDKDLWFICQEGPEAILNQTEITQVVMLTADIALFRVLQQRGMPLPSLMAGHSLGEYAALVAANALTLEQAARLVAKRGELMQATVPIGKGGMAAIVGLTDEQVKDICSRASHGQEQVSPANFNAIGQVVIAGETHALARAIQLAEAAEARMAKIIPVSVPCHCDLLRPASLAFEQALADVPFQVPQIPVMSNVDLSIYESPSQLRRLLAQQLYKPVRWVETIQAISAQGMQTLIECGPGKVLSGLVKRIDKSLQVLNASEMLASEEE